MQSKGFLRFATSIRSKMRSLRIVRLFVRMLSVVATVMMTMIMIMMTDRSCQMNLFDVCIKGHSADNKAKTNLQSRSKGIRGITSCHLLALHSHLRNKIPQSLHNEIGDIASVPTYRG